jgi:hypothetical protein
MEGTREQIVYMKNSKTNFTLSAKKTKINQTSNEEMGGKDDIITGRLATYLMTMRRRRHCNEKVAYSLVQHIKVDSFQ